jgi:hypothetical protein
VRQLIRFVPLVLVYVLVFSVVDLTESPRSDAARYLWFAENLTRGSYAPGDNVNLWSGPGYPLVLAALVAPGLPDYAAKILNGLFMLGAVIYLYFALRPYVGSRVATIACYVLGLWPAAIKILPEIMTEPLAVFLACGLVFHLSRAHAYSRYRRANLAGAAAFLGYLALTRVAFGYVIPVALAVFLILYLIRHQASLRRDLLVCCLALVVCLPYLAYTYSLTGRIFYWGSSGGMSLYWMSSPYDGELGEWHTMMSASSDPELSKNHKSFLAEVGGLSIIARDDAFRRKALENIREHPTKYLRNWSANLGRLFFNYPRSHLRQKPHIIPDLVSGISLLVMAALCLVPTWQGRRRIPHEIWALLLIGIIYLGGTSLLSAYHRFLLPVIPMGIFWMAFVLSKVIRIEVLR